MPDFSQVSAVVTDISGTTTSVEFIEDVLLPYAQTHFVQFVNDHLTHPKVQSCLQDTAQETQIDGNNHAALLEHLHQCMELNVKSYPLKTLQSLIWLRGYQQDHFQSHIYKDAHQQLSNWQQSGLKLFSFSSESVDGQKDFFQYSQAGNVLPLFSGHFDTRTGHKQEARAYGKIVHTLKQPPERILFLSDHPKELDAARQAGMQTCQIKRHASASLASHHPCVADFHGIKLG